MAEKDRVVWHDDHSRSLKVVSKCITTVVAIGAVVYLEVQALHAGINGALLAASIAVVAGLGGYELKGILDKKKENS